ncbi:hypothetical protein MNBD_GAMMA12-2185 [hydrothermal vent metagenome]|uniref:Uncharacterized protein n=1 Tax=hydrothermal vent metagenome TaxID=652676 RepID=A0A3B0XYQ7_9ZZZZ
MHIYLKGIELTDNVTENLKNAKKTFFRLYKPYRNHTLNADDLSNVRSYSYETDGNLLLLPAISDLRDRLMTGGGTFLILPIVGLFVELLVGDGSAYSLILTLFIIGLVPLALGVRLKSTGYFVFNRTAGTVLFPAKWNRSSFTLRFEDIHCHPNVHIMQFGGIHRTNYLWANKVPQNESRRLREVAIAATSRDIAQLEWSLICTFMDQSEPVPDIPAFSKRSNYYKKHNLSLQEVFSKPVHEDFLYAHIIEELEESQKNKRSFDFIKRRDRRFIYLTNSVDN